jgi:hypothetical protein
MTMAEEENHLPERHRQFFTDINEGCLRRVDRASVPLLGVQDEKIVHDRTGVLYRAGGHHFILSASHSLQKIVEHNIPLYVSMNRPGVMPIGLGPAKFSSTEEIGRDVSAIWLPPEIANEIAKYKDFLPHRQIDLEGADSRGPFAFFGYPMAWSGHVIQDYIVSEGLVFLGFPHTGLRHKEALYDPKLHMVMGFERDAINELKGGIDRLPRLKGISGCGIWQVGDIEDKKAVARSTETVTLVGIQHTWYPDLNYVQGTKIRHALAFIQQNFPEVSPAMSIVYPKKSSGG